MIGLRLYDSLFKVIPLDKDQAELKATLTFIGAIEEGVAALAKGMGGS